jgi:YspA, cpYpsA-related SLOG family
VRVIVCGGRNYGNDAAWNHVLSVLEAMHAEHQITAVIQGGAPGADLQGALWAEMRGIKCVTVPADWNAHGKAAGPIRNKRMLTDFSPDVVVAFPGGRGTADMVRQAKAAGVDVLEYSQSDASAEQK